MSMALDMDLDMEALVTDMISTFLLVECNINNMYRTAWGSGSWLETCLVRPSVERVFRDAGYNNEVAENNDEGQFSMRMNSSTMRPIDELFDIKTGK